MAEKNAFILLRKRQFKAAVAVFLLARPAMLKEALQVSCKPLRCILCSRSFCLVKKPHWFDDQVLGPDILLTSLNFSCGVALLIPTIFDAVVTEVS